MRQALGVWAVLAGMLAGRSGAGETPPPTIPPMGSRAKIQTPRVPEAVTGSLRALNKQLSRGLKPDDNAVVLLLEVMGPEALESELLRPTLDLLGVTTLPEQGPRFIPIRDFVRSSGTVSEKDAEPVAVTIESDLVLASERPWKKVDSARLLDYLAANREVLDRVVQASNKPRYYAPVLSTEMPPRMLGMAVNIERRLPFLARLLVARGLNRFAEGDLAAARDDWLAVRRLARLLANGSPFDVSGAKAQVIDSVVWHAMIELVRSGELTATQARELLQDEERVPELPDASVAAHVGERALIQQEIEFLQADPAAVRDFFVAPEASESPEGEKSQEWGKGPSTPVIDWSLARDEAHRIQDKVREALATQDRATREKRFAELDANYKAWEQSADDMARKFTQSTDDSSEAASRWVGRTMAMSLRSWYRQRRLSDERNRLRRDLLRIGLALTVFREEHKAYPETLAELSPGLLKTVPTDPFSDRPYVYNRTTDDGAKLISLGPNRTDDAGQVFNDDTVITLP